MKLSEFKTHLDTLGLSVAYQEFGDDNEVAPPFIIYYEDEVQTFSADDVPYMKFVKLIIELYSDYKDLSLEGKIESLLYDLEINYITDETYIDSEQMYGKFYYLGGIIYDSE